MRDRTGNLRDFDAVCQPCTVEVRLPDAENLRFPLKPSERCAMQDAVSISFRRMPMVLGRNRILSVSSLQQEFIHKALCPGLREAAD
jgi:hypothetical protein